MNTPNLTLFICLSLLLLYDDFKGFVNGEQNIAPSKAALTKQMQHVPVQENSTAYKKGSAALAVRMRRGMGRNRAN
jgi:hypothetical protein